MNNIEAAKKELLEARVALSEAFEISTPEVREFLHQVLRRIESAEDILSPAPPATIV